MVTESAVESKTFVFSTYYSSFEQWMLEHDLSDRTIRLYKIGLKNFREWFERKTGDGLDPAMITLLDVRAYRIFLYNDQRMKAQSVNSYLAAVRSFCRWAMDKGLIMGDPSSGIKGIDIQKRPPRWLPKTEQYALLRVALQEVQLGDLRAKGDKSAPGYIWPRRDRAILVLMLNTGLRLFEVTALDLDDVVIRPRSGELTVRLGKGGKMREVDLNKDARAALSEWMEVRPASESKAMFISQKGKGRMTARAIARRIEEIGVKAQVKVTPHMLRHSMAKNMVDEGVSLDQVKDTLGHSNLNTTTLYTQPSRSDSKAAMEKIAWRG